MGNTTVASGKTRPHDIGISATVSIENKIRVEQMLLGALYREPFNLHNHINQLSRVALSNATNGLDVIFLEILDQFIETGYYSITTVSEKTGGDAGGFFASEFTDIGLDWAVENWWDEYQVWAECTALMRGVEFDCIQSGALKMREEVEATRERLGANGVMTKPYDAENFLEWGIDKLDGKEKVYSTPPPLAELRGIVRFFKPGYMWIISGAGGMGKTQFSLNLVSYFHDNGANGVFFSLEMTSDDVFRRLLGIRHGINHEADWSAGDTQKISRALSETASLKDSIDILDNVFSMSEIEAVATAKYYAAIGKGKPLNYIFVDYVQMVVASGKHANRDGEVGSVSSALTRLAKRLNVPVFALSPISRETVKRGGSKRPQLTDLRECGRLEFDAYGVMFVYRPEYYGIKEDENGQSLVDRAEIIVAKHRNGRVGSAMCAYGGIRGFTDLIPESKFPTAEPQDFTQPKSEAISTDTIRNARPDLDNEKAPF